ncbi:LysR family transcriptional regulator [Thalassotalea maritima]|uniref:LysR family transcriptional regulator n=1 Tax=Thalassotalea maritima TaxID=3242416 RepID=UPI0035270F8D
MNIATRDLNLLLLFKILYQEQKAVIAAEKLAISQPALSHRLARLRQEFNDPLFVRSPKGLTPTPKAHALAPKVIELTQQIESFYQADSKIELRDVEETVYIYTTDYMESILLPELIHVVHQSMPKLKLVTLNTRGQFPKTELEQGDCDIAIAGFYEDLPASFFQQKIKQEQFKVLANSTCNFSNDTLCLEDYINAKHIVTTLNGNLDGVVDKSLKSLGMQRQVIAGISSFVVPPYIVSKSDVLLTCLASIADIALTLHPNLRSYDAPIDLPHVNIYQIWHERTHVDPVRKFIRNQIAALMKNL